MSDYRTALCIVRKRDTSPYPMLHRIADIHGNRLTQAEYNTHAEDGSAPITIGNKSWESKVIGDIHIRSWKPREGDPQKNDSVEIEGEPYEVILCDQLNDISIEDQKSIREVLYEGLDFPDNVCNNLLLTSSQKGDEKWALACRKKDFTHNGHKYAISQDCSDMIHIPHAFRIVPISFDQLISLELLNEKDYFDDSIGDRYFYNQLDPDFNNSKLFHLHSIEDYEISFIKKHLSQRKTAYGFTKKVVGQICDALDQIMSDEAAIEDYYQQTLYSKEQVIEQLSSNLNGLKKVLSGNDDFDKAIRHSMKGDEAFYRECIDLVRKEWIEEKDSECLEIDKKISLKASELDGVNEEIQEAQSELRVLNEDLQERKDLIGDSIQREKEIEASINEKLDAFENDIVEKVLVSTIAGANTNARAEADNNEALLTLKPEANKEASECDDIIELLEVLEDNLIDAGIDGYFTYELAVFIYANICINRAFAICGSMAHSVGDAISMSMDGCTAAKIVVPNLYTDIKGLQTAIGSISERVIVIDNCIDTFNEQLILSLYRLFPEKIFICSCNNEDNIRLLPKDCLRTIVWLDCADFSFPTHSHDYSPLKTRPEIYSATIDAAQVRKKVKDFRELFDMFKLDSFIAYDFACVEKIIKQVYSEKAEINLFNYLRLPNSHDTTVSFDYLQDMINPVAKEYLSKNTDNE